MKELAFVGALCAVIASVFGAFFILEDRLDLAVKQQERLREALK